MEPVFVWDNSPLRSPPKDRIEESFSLALEVANSRNLNPAKLVVRLTLDKSQTAIDGIGYDQDARPLFICSCHLGGPTASYYCYYYGENDPRQSQS